MATTTINESRKQFHIHYFRGSDGAGVNLPLFSVTVASLALVYGKRYWSNKKKSAIIHKITLAS